MENPSSLSGCRFEGLCRNEAGHLRGTAAQRIRRSDVKKADRVAIAASDALRPLLELCTIPFKAMAGVAQPAGGHAMQDVVFLVGCGDQYRFRSHVAKYRTFDPRQAARIDVLYGFHQSSSIKTLEFPLGILERAIAHLDPVGLVGKAKPQHQPCFTEHALINVDTDDAGELRLLRLAQQQLTRTAAEIEHAARATAEQVVDHRMQAFLMQCAGHSFLSFNPLS